MAVLRQRHICAPIGAVTVSAVLLLWVAYSYHTDIAAGIGTPQRISHTPPGESLTATTATVRDGQRRPVAVRGNSPRRGSAKEGAVDVVLSCFVRTDDGFYKTRSLPGVEWMVALVRSVYRFRRGTSGVETRFVFFLDPRSAAELQERLQHTGTGRHAVAIHAAPHVDDDDAGDAFLTIRVVKNTTDGDGALLRQQWANGVKNGANNFRFALFESELKRREWHDRVRYVMVTDATDAVWQANAFDHCMPPHTQAMPRPASTTTTTTRSTKAVGVAAAASTPSPPPLVVFTLEEGREKFRPERKRQKGEKFNRYWMWCLGSDAVRTLGRRRAPVSCAGVTFGTHSGLLVYTAAQLEVLQRPSVVKCSINRVEAALDQAAHNALLHRVANTSHFFQHRTRVMTAPMERVVGASVEVPEGDGTQRLCTFHGNFGKVEFQSLQADGEDLEERVVVGRLGGDPKQKAVPFAVVHQYTSGRHPGVMQTVRQQYL